MKKYEEKTEEDHKKRAYLKGIPPDFKPGKKGQEDIKHRGCENGDREGHEEGHVFVNEKKMGPPLERGLYAIVPLDVGMKGADSFTLHDFVEGGDIGRRVRS